MAGSLFGILPTLNFRGIFFSSVFISVVFFFWAICSIISLKKHRLRSVLYPPERASHFEQLKEFQAAQNTTCHLLSANTISVIECLLTLLKFSSFKTALKYFLFPSCTIDGYKTKGDCVCQTKTVWKRGWFNVFICGNIDLNLSWQQKIRYDWKRFLKIENLISWQHAFLKSWHQEVLTPI